MKNIYLLYSLLLILLSGCYGENPFVDKSVIDEIEKKKNPDVKNVAFIYNNEVYYMSGFNNTPKKITNSGGIKMEVRVNHSGTKIAYINLNSYPVIIDTTGTVIEVVDQYGKVEKLDWSKDDNTLYMLINNQLQYHGPSLSVPELDFPNTAVNQTSTILDISISANNDLAYIFKTYSFYNGYIYTCVFKKNGNNESQILNTSVGNIMKYVRFAPVTNEIILGYGTYNSDNYINKFEIYPYLSNYAISTFESTEEYIDPMYRSDLQYFVGGYKMYSYDNSFSVAKKRFYPNDGNDIILSNYNNLSSPLYINWK